MKGQGPTEFNLTDLGKYVFKVVAVEKFSTGPQECQFNAVEPDVDALEIRSTICLGSGPEAPVSPEDMNLGFKLGTNCENLIMFRALGLWESTLCIKSSWFLRPYYCQVMIGELP